MNSKQDSSYFLRSTTTTAATPHDPKPGKEVTPICLLNNKPTQCLTVSQARIIWSGYVVTAGKSYPIRGWENGGRV